MEFIKPTVELITPGPTVLDMYKHVEMVGRVCYHSEDKITDTSWSRFINHQVAQGHMSPLEAGTVYWVLPSNHELVDFFKLNTYSFVTIKDNEAFITTNLRVIVENNLKHLLTEYWKFTEYHIPRICFKWETCIEVYKDITRHRSLSPMVESTRFCNYLLSKFSHSVKFSLPCWLGYKSNYPDDEKRWCEEKLRIIEEIYFEAQDRWEWDAQRASYFLPQGTHATCFFTGFLQDWEWFLALRFEQITGSVRPDVLEISTEVARILKEMNYYE